MRETRVDAIRHGNFTACGHAASRVAGGENENAAADVNKSEQTGETESRLET